ncbi:hypothetical protein [Bacillus sp. SM2101]|uniref:hypothetical protein n=1 Tax=Bacillus sp. SM2101 TaxID=2805366 RepID=UPI001BDE563E|nr:hypothetical protein [Bacillus sp. SM2101]
MGLDPGHRHRITSEAMALQDRQRLQTNLLKGDVIQYGSSDETGCRKRRKPNSSFPGKKATLRKDLQI